MERLTPHIRLYVFLGITFNVITVTSNLIFKKFVGIQMFGMGFELSIGVLLYPLTFLITDLLTELFGKKAASTVVTTNMIMNLVVAALMYVGGLLPATPWSSVTDADFQNVFGSYGLAVVASLGAIFIAQLADIMIFDWLRKQTNGRHLWLRNNVSTIIAQALDTVTVVGLLTLGGVIPAEQSMGIMQSSFTFKVIAALLDTPFCYLGVWMGNRYLGRKD